jgi:hypothetical protein
VKRILPTAVAISVGFIVLLDFFIENPYLRTFRSVFTEWAIVVAAFALVLGAINVFRFHLIRIGEGRDVIYSLALISVMFLITTFGILGGPRNPLVSWMFDYVQFPIQSTIFSLLAFFVASAACRAFRARTWESALLLAVCIIVLLGQAPVGALVWGHLHTIKSWLLEVPAMAGARGIILGVALGTVATGIRILLGIDRPYGEE